MNDRFSRQADIVPRERILDCIATIIGVGAIEDRLHCSSPL
ncbi:hypothetical protein ACFL3G_00505 [Planctomycetota bacterium]